MASASDGTGCCPAADAAGAASAVEGSTFRATYSLFISLAREPSVSSYIHPLSLSLRPTLLSHSWTYAEPNSSTRPDVEPNSSPRAARNQTPVHRRSQTSGYTDEESNAKYSTESNSLTCEETSGYTYYVSNFQRIHGVRIRPRPTRILLSVATNCVTHVHQSASLLIKRGYTQRLSGV